MELISMGNVILNADRISALDIDQKEGWDFRPPSPNGFGRSDH